MTRATLPSPVAAWPMRFVARVVAIVATLLLLLSACSSPAELAAGEETLGSVGVGTRPVIVALCHGSNQDWPEYPDQAYFEYLFSETGGSETIADYWRDVSHGNFSIDGSRVLDVQLDIPRDAIGDRDDNDFGKCRDGVDAQYDIDWDEFSGPVVIKPQTRGTTAHAIDADDTQLQIRTVAPGVMDDWPAPPFTLVLTKNGSLWRNADEAIENVRVTAVSKDYDSGIITFTIEREQSGYRDRTPPAKPFPEGTEVKDISDIYGSQNRTAVVSAITSPAVLNQELGHFFGFPHSRRLSTATSGYNDCFDVMSTITCAHVFGVPLQFPGGNLPQEHGPGMTSIFLDWNGWLPSEDRREFCAEERTYSMRALGLDGSDPLQVRVPVQVPIRDGVTSEYLTIELRSQQFHWDQGIPRDAFVLHLRGTDGLPYLITDPGAGGTSGMVAGDRYEFGNATESALDDRVIIVDDIDAATGTGTITVINPSWAVAPCLAAGGFTDGPDGDTSSTEPTSTEPTAPSDGTTTTDPQGTTTTTDSDETVCVPGTWELNSQAFIDSIASQTGSGSMGGELVFQGGTYTMTITPDGQYTAVRHGWTFSFVTDEGTFTSIFESHESGTMSWEDDGTLAYSEETTTTVNDVTVILDVGGFEQVFEGDAAEGMGLPSPPLMSGTGVYTCVGDSLVIVPDDSGIEISWTRAG